LSTILIDPIRIDSHIRSCFYGYKIKNAYNIMYYLYFLWFCLKHWKRRIADSKMPANVCWRPDFYNAILHYAIFKSWFIHIIHYSHYSYKCIIHVTLIFWKIRLGYNFFFSIHVRTIGISVVFIKTPRAIIQDATNQYVYV